MKVKIEIDCSNAAFEGDSCELEVGRILSRLGNEMVHEQRYGLRDAVGDMHVRLRDVNGNTVGSLTTKQDG